MSSACLARGLHFLSPSSPYCWWRSRIIYVCLSDLLWLSFYHYPASPSSIFPQTGQTFAGDTPSAESPSVPSVFAWLPPSRVTQVSAQMLPVNGVFPDHSNSRLIFVTFITIWHSLLLFVYSSWSVSLFFLHGTSVQGPVGLGHRISAVQEGACHTVVMRTNASASITPCARHNFHSLLKTCFTEKFQRSTKVG